MPAEERQNQRTGRSYGPELGESTRYGSICELLGALDGEMLPVKKLVA